MRTVTINDSTKPVSLDTIKNYTPIFVKYDGILKGMLMQEQKTYHWAISLGGVMTYDGYKQTRQECVKDGLNNGYTFHVED